MQQQQQGCLTHITHHKLKDPLRVPASQSCSSSSRAVSHTSQAQRPAESPSISIMQQQQQGCLTHITQHKLKDPLRVPASQSCNSSSSRAVSHTSQHKLKDPLRVPASQSCSSSSSSSRAVSHTSHHKLKDPLRVPASQSCSSSRAVSHTSHITSSKTR